MRLAREQTDAALEAAERSALLLQKHDLAVATEQAAQLAAKGHKVRGLGVGMGVKIKGRGRVRGIVRVRVSEG